MHADPSPRKLVLTLALAGLLGVTAGFAADNAPPKPTSDKPDKSGGVHARLIVETPLIDVAGKKLTMVRVRFDPGGAMESHKHTGTVLVYVLSGALRSKFGDAPARVYHEGESWVEQPGIEHAVCENASTSEPAELVATLMSDLAPTTDSDAPSDTLQPSGRHHQ